VPKLDAQLLTRCFLAELGGSSVLVDHAAEDLVASDRGAERDHGGGVVGWWVLAQALVRAVVIEMAHVLVENGAGVSFVVDQQPVGALGADAADEPFRVAVRPGRTGRDLDHGDAFGGEDGVEGSGELGVPIADQKAEGADLLTQVHQQIAGGLSGPVRGRVSGHPKDVHFAGPDLHDKQDVDPAQRDRVEGEEVGGQQSGGLSAQEGPPSGVRPAWCWSESSGGQDPPNRAGTYAMPETDEFALDPAVAPGRVLPCQAQHQGPDLVINRWAT
jgi:hypothetical protein